MKSSLPNRRDRPEFVNLSASDWKAGTAMLPALAEWTYWQISLHCMDKGEAVAPAILPMILVRHGGDWQADVDLLVSLGKVQKTASGGLFVRRALVEYERSLAAMLKKQKAGARGAQKRWQNNDSDSSANGNANATPMAIEKEKEKETENLDPLSEDTRGQADFLIDIDEAVFAEFAEHRIEIRRPLTERAATMIRNELIRILEQHGHNPSAVLRQSIANGWTGVFPLKADNGSNGKRSGWRFPDE